MTSTLSDRTAVCHSPGEPDPRTGQACRWCGTVFVDPEALRQSPEAYWPTDKLVVEYKPGFDGSERSFRRQLTPPMNASFCNEVGDG